MSVCYWIKPDTLTSYETHLSLAASNYENDILHLCKLRLTLRSRVTLSSLYMF